MAQPENAYTVEFTDIAINNLKRYPANDQRRILSKIEQLAANPLAMPNVKRLVNFEVTYRLRVGDYRILFDRDDTIRIIDVLDVLPRSRAYRRS